MDFETKCYELYHYTEKLAERDLIDLMQTSSKDLVDEARKLYDNMKEYEKNCANKLPRKMYKLGISMYHLALLKISAVLESKLKDSSVRDEFIKYLLEYYTEDEKNALRELERFSGLDKEDPKDLANIIVAEEGEIYKLIREAVIKEYVNCAKVIKTWESGLKIRNDVTRAFEKICEKRFRRIIDAIKILLDQQPGWLRRLFKEYENALLESAEVRVKFENEFRKVFTTDMHKLESILKSLEEENASLRNRIAEIYSTLTRSEEERRKREEELAMLRQEYESVRRRYETILSEYKEKLDELERLKVMLQEKEKELEKIRNSMEVTVAGRVALENELLRLREIVKKYEEEKLKYITLESRVKELEQLISGKLTGNLVTREEVEYFYEVVVGRARRKLEERRISLLDPRTFGEISIRNWDNVERFHINLGDENNPLMARGIKFTKSTGTFFKRRDVVVEYLVLSHFSETSESRYDNQPVTLSDFIKVLVSRAREAENEGYYHILIVCSPTGFAEELARYVSNIASKYMSVYLVDLIKGQIYYNQNDPVAKNNSLLAHIELPEEQVEKVIKYLLSDEAKIKAIERSPTVKFLFIEDIRKHTGVTDELVLRRALNILQERGIGQVKEYDNQLVFVYEKL